MQSIEELMREHLKGAEQQPPEDILDDLLARKNNARHQDGVRHVRSWLWPVAIIGAAATAAVTLWLATLPGNTLEHKEQSTMTQLQGQDVASLLPDETAITRQKPTPTSGFPQSGNAKTSDDEKEMPYFSDLPGDPARPMPLTEETEQRPTLQEEPVGQEYEVPATTMPATDSVDRHAMTKQKTEEEKPQEMKQEPVIRIPNILSPNGDGINDCWLIPDVEQYNRVQVQVFNAAGHRVFSSNNYNGEFCGADLPDGNYFYTLVINEIKYIRRGVLVIKR